MKNQFPISDDRLDQLLEAMDLPDDELDQWLENQEDKDQLDQAMSILLKKEESPKQPKRTK
jgi:hypothetical protein